MIGNDREATISSDVGELELFTIGNTPNSTGTLNIADGAVLVLRRGYAGGAGGNLGGTDGPATGTINMSGGELAFQGNDPRTFYGHGKWGTRVSSTCRAVPLKRTTFGSVGLATAR